MLLHFFHFDFNTRVKLVFKFKALHMIHVSIAIEKISLQRGPGPLLCIPGSPRFLLIITITIVPKEEEITEPLRLSKAYHDEPWGSHWPKHTQQKSILQF